MQRTRITVLNMNREQVWRGGYVFSPKSEKTISVTEVALAEIKACSLLSYIVCAFPCNFNGCAFVAKTEEELKYHKTTHSQKKQKKDQVVDKKKTETPAQVRKATKAKLKEKVKEPEFVQVEVTEDNVGKSVL